MLTACLQVTHSKMLAIQTVTRPCSCQSLFGKHAH